MSFADEIDKLVALRDAGHLTAAEFEQAKARLLNDQPPASEASAGQRLRRSTSDRWIGGVCGGLARYTGIESWIVRLVCAVAILCFGIGLLPYLLLWIFMPLDDVSSRS